MRLPLELTDFRRGAPLWLPAVLMLALLAWDVGFHRPTQARVQKLMLEAEQAGISTSAALHPTLVPPTVQTLLDANTIPEARLAEMRRSGALAADLLKATTEKFNRAGIRVVATEPGLAVTSGDETVVRAHLRAVGSYGEFVRFLDAMARDPRLIAVDQFTLRPIGGSELSLDLSVSRLVVQPAKAGGGTP